MRPITALRADGIRIGELSRLAGVTEDLKELGVIRRRLIHGAPIK
jgi:hypothetical protein